MDKFAEIVPAESRRKTFDNNNNLQLRSITQKFGTNNSSTSS